jgi:diguanylate cyclase (GGDEF)-like protein
VADAEALVGRGLLAHPTDGVALLRAIREDGQVVDFVHELANRPAARSSGRELVGHRLLEEVAPAATEGLFPWLVAVLESGGQDTRRTRMDLPDVPLMHGVSYEMFAQAVDGDRVVLHVRDLTEEVGLRHALEHDALHDALTGLPNRRWFARRVRRALNRLDRRPGTVALFFCDVDDFKLVNDTFGHVAGDDLLCQIADRVAAAVRPADSVARFGGDELVVLCEELDDPVVATQIAGRVHAAACGTYQVGEATVHVTVSVGVALTDVPIPTQRLVSEADTALYEAKRLGRNRVELYDKRLGETAANRLRVRDELARAIDEGQLELHYQPEFDLVTGHVVAAEALLRWRHPDGMREPASFLPVAEATGLMARIGSWVLRTACLEAQSWDGMTPPDVNVNLSARELMHPDLVPVLRDAVAASGVDPQRIAVEMTETYAADELDRLTSVLEQIRGLGMTLALDDFGTGHSSLMWLQRFPISMIKLDRSFVARLTAGPSDRTIVSATIAMAHALGMTVVAEGIETPAQQRLLMDMGCDLGQGFWLARPMPAAELHALIRRSAEAAHS